MAWDENLNHTPANSLLVCTSERGLIRFYCPIAAICIQETEYFTYGQKVFIEGVYQPPGEIMHYVIGGIAYPYNHFTLNT